MPIPPPPTVPRPRRRTYGAAGAVLLVLAAVLYAGHVLIAGDGSHSWDRHASPPAQVQVTAGQSYFVSTVDGPDVTPSPQPLSCEFTVPGTGRGGGLSLVALDAASRSTHAVASFVSPVSGAIAVTCRGGTVGSRAVFVDDSDDAGTDSGSWLLVLAVLAGLPGAGLVLGALYTRGTRRRVARLTPGPSA